MIYVVGHKNPDTDSVASAIALSYFLKDSSPAILGEPNLETTFVLEFLQAKQPVALTNLRNLDLYLVDHSEKTQTLESINFSNIIAIIDHHKIDINTQTPIIYLCKPLGSTATIISELYLSNSMHIINAQNIPINQTISTLLISAIISDTLLFSSPTTTEVDIEVAKKLLQYTSLINEKNLNDFGIQMLKAKSSISSKTPSEIFNTDSKEFLMHNKKVLISQIESISPQEIEPKINDIKNIMFQKLEKEEFDLIIFVISDILKKSSHFIVLGDQKNFEKAFNTKLINNESNINGIISRKKQIVPPIEACYSTLQI